MFESEQHTGGYRVPCTKNYVFVYIFNNYNSKDREEKGNKEKKKETFCFNILEVNLLFGMQITSLIM